MWKNIEDIFRAVSVIILFQGIIVLAWQYIKTFCFMEQLFGPCPVINTIKRLYQKLAIISRVQTQGNDFVWTALGGLRLPVYMNVHVLIGSTVKPLV